MHIKDLKLLERANINGNHIYVKNGHQVKKKKEKKKDIH